MDRFGRGGGKVRFMDTFGSGHVKFGEAVSIYHNRDVDSGWSMSLELRLETWGW